MRLSSRNTAVGYATELTSGVSYYEAIKEMLTTAQDDWPSLLARLERLRGTINARDGLMINLTSDPDAIDGAKPQLDAFVGRMPAAPAADAHGEDAPEGVRPTFIREVFTRCGMDGQARTPPSGRGCRWRRARTRPTPSSRR